MRAGMTDCVRHVRNEVESRKNGEIQSMTIEFKGGVRVRGASISHTVLGV